MKKFSLIVLAAGKGSRLYPMTHHIPKAMVRYKGKPLIEHVLKPFIALVDEIIIVINTGQTSSVLTSYLGNNFEHLHLKYVVQDLEKNKGTWYAFREGAQAAKNNNLLVVNSDDIFSSSEIRRVLINTSPHALGITKTIMPIGYTGFVIKKGNIVTYKPLDSTMKHYYSNGLYKTMKSALDLKPVQLTNGEYGLPQTLLALSGELQPQLIKMRFWKTVNSVQDLQNQ